MDSLSSSPTSSSSSSPPSSSGLHTLNSSNLLSPVPRRPPHGILVRHGSSDYVAKRCVKWSSHEAQIFEVEEWDRSPCPVTPKLTYRDLLELKQLEMDKMPHSPFRSLADLPVYNLPRVRVGLQPIFDRPSTQPPTPETTPAPTPERSESPVSVAVTTPNRYGSRGPISNFKRFNNLTTSAEKSNESPPSPTHTALIPQSDSHVNHGAVSLLSPPATATASSALSIASALLAPSPVPPPTSSGKAKKTIAMKGFTFMPLLPSSDPEPQKDVLPPIPTTPPAETPGVGDFVEEITSAQPPMIHPIETSDSDPDPDAAQGGVEEPSVPPDDPGDNDTSAIQTDSDLDSSSDVTENTSTTDDSSSQSLTMSDVSISSASSVSPPSSPSLPPLSIPVPAALASASSNDTPASCISFVSTTPAWPVSPSSSSALPISIPSCKHPLGSGVPLPAPVALSPRSVSMGWDRGSGNCGSGVAGLSPTSSVLSASPRGRV